MPASGPDSLALPRAVVFLTAPCAAEIPAHEGSVACLLPFGFASFAERVMDSCVRAGLRELDLVVSEQPEAVRACLGDGSRWGLKLTWHLARQSASPYAVLHSLGLQRGQRLLVGHGDRWVADRVLKALVEKDRVAVQVAESIHWSGWISMDSLFVHSISPHADFAVLSEVALSLHGLHASRCVVAGAGELAHGGTARQLLAAQAQVLQDVAGDTIPAAWLRLPWGARSPDANVHPQARMQGPVLVGPGCMVQAGAEVGPGTVLSRDVLVAEGAVVRDTLVLPNTYVGGDITLDHAIAQGNAVQHLKWSVRTVLPLEDAVLAPLVPQRLPRASWSGRLLAALLAVLLLPAALLLAALQLLQGRPPLWQALQAAVGGGEGEEPVRLCWLRSPLPDVGRVGWLVGVFGALLDVAQGRRHWFGMRPRTASEWSTLGHDWQTLLGRTPVGLFHAPAWTEPGTAPDSESLAVADAYFAVRNGLGERIRILTGLFRAG